MSGTGLFAIAHIYSFNRKTVDTHTENNKYKHKNSSLLKFDEKRIRLNYVMERLHQEFVSY
jgi:hypothetical protein